VDGTDRSSEQPAATRTRPAGNGAKDYLPAREAAALLDVKLATLYAYTSRGLVQSVPGPSGRARLYRRHDLERLRARRDARAGHGAVAAGALRFGEPVLDSAITSISATGGPAYRGFDAVGLAHGGATFEAVAELLWTGAPPGEGTGGDRWQSEGLGVSVDSLRDLLPETLPPLTGLAVLLPLLASRDPGRFAEGMDAVLPRARMLIRRMAAGLALTRPRSRSEGATALALGAGSVASTIAKGLTADCGEEGVAAINAALVLGADHELNASTFAARVAASTGADIYGGVAAALACLSGPRHGGASDRVEALVAEIGSPERAERVLHERQRRGEGIEGFRHPLYPDGDPRGAYLVELAHELAPTSTPVRAFAALSEAMQESGAGAPNIDAGLVALSLALGLPPGCAVGIFAVARSAGWVAHMLEQYEAGYLVRPRARYLGPD
jgi:citrate synthase